MDASAVGGIETTERSLDLGMARVADQDQLTAFAGIAAYLHVHLRHERARSIEHREPAIVGFRLHGARHAMSREDDRAGGRHLAQLVDEDRTERAQTLHDVPVVNDLVTHVDRRSEQLDGALDDVDGTIDTSTESAGVGQQYSHYAPPLMVCAAEDRLMCRRSWRRGSRARRQSAAASPRW